MANGFKCNTFKVGPGEADQLGPSFRQLGNDRVEYRVHGGMCQDLEPYVRKVELVSREAIPEQCPKLRSGDQCPACSYFIARREQGFSVPDSATVKRDLLEAWLLTQGNPPPEAPPAPPPPAEKDVGVYIALAAPGSLDASHHEIKVGSSTNVWYRIQQQRLTLVGKLTCPEEHLRATEAWLHAFLRRADAPRGSHGRESYVLTDAVYAVVQGLPWPWELIHAS